LCLRSQVGCDRVSHHWSRRPLGRRRYVTRVWARERTAEPPLAGESDGSILAGALGAICVGAETLSPPPPASSRAWAPLRGWRHGRVSGTGCRRCAAACRAGPHDETGGDDTGCGATNMSSSSASVSWNCGGRMDVTVTVTVGTAAVAWTLQTAHSSQTARQKEWRCPAGHCAPVSTADARSFGRTLCGAARTDASNQHRNRCRVASGSYEAQRASPVPPASRLPPPLRRASARCNSSAQSLTRAAREAPRQSERGVQWRASVQGCVLQINQQRQLGHGHGHRPLPI